MQGRRRVPLSLAHPARVYWLVAVATLCADQISKSVVRVLWSSPVSKIPLDSLTARFIAPGFGSTESLPVLGQAFRITLVRNTGAAFGIFPGYQPIFIATSLLVLLVIMGYQIRTKPDSWPVVIALALVSGGAFGNLIDRALIGRVTDFFDLAIVDFPVFNIADSAILIGVGILIVWLLFGPQPSAATSAPELHSVEAQGSGSSEGHEA